MRGREDEKIKGKKKEERGKRDEERDQDVGH